MAPQVRMMTPLPPASQNPSASITVNCITEKRFLTPFHVPRESTVLSLRQIALPGFLPQTFAADWSAGCQS